MKHNVLYTLLVGAIAGLASLPQPAGAQEEEAAIDLHGRISLADENALIKGQTDADWSYAALNSLVMPGDSIWADESGAIEIELPGDVFVRLADGSRLDVAALSPRTVVKAWTGSFYLQRMRAAVGGFTLETPVSSIQINPDTLVRVDILDDGATTVSVRWGRAQVIAGVGEPVELLSSQRTYIDPGLQPSEPARFDRSVEDDFDVWNRDRSRSLAKAVTSGQGQGPVASTASSSGSSRPLGMSDLNQYGVWVEIDGEMYWKPTYDSTFVPYRNGSWSYVPSHGYIWTGQQPFSYVTTHYGYWSYNDHHGWLWYYTPVYAPARVASVRYGDYFIWAPLNRHGHTYYHGSDYFTVGGIHFGYGHSSYAFQYHVTSGYAPTYSLYSHHVSHYYPTHVYYWNIHHHHHNHHYGSSHHYAHHHLYNNHYYNKKGQHKPGGHQLAVNRPTNNRKLLPTRDYTPKRVMRGRTISNNAVYASQRANTLQKRTRTSFEPTNVVQRPTTRTGVNTASRAANVRTTRLARVEGNNSPNRFTRGNPSTTGNTGVVSNRQTRPGTTNATSGNRVTRSGTTDARRGGVTNSPSRATRGTVGGDRGGLSPSGTTNTSRPTRIQSPQTDSSRSTRGTVSSGRGLNPSQTNNSSRPTRIQAPRVESAPSQSNNPRRVISPQSRSTRNSGNSSVSPRATRGPAPSAPNASRQSTPQTNRSYSSPAPSVSRQSAPQSNRSYSSPAPSVSRQSAPQSSRSYSSPAPSVSRQSAPSSSRQSVSAPSSRGRSSSAPSVSRGSSSSGSSRSSSSGGGSSRGSSSGGSSRSSGGRGR